MGRQWGQVLQYDIWTSNYSFNHQPIRHKTQQAAMQIKVAAATTHRAMIGLKSLT